MKKSILLLLSIFLVGSITAQSKYKTKEQIKHFYLTISRKYCSDAFEILSSDKKANYTRYVNGHKKEDLIEAFGTAVHETQHGYNFDIGGFDGEGYFFGNGIELLVPKTEVVNSHLLNSFVSKSKREKCDRYKTYIGRKTPFLGSQVGGVYGLLDEFSAYYHGLKAEIEIRKAGLRCPTFSWQSNNLEAFYEFKLFISWYLQMCKKNHKKVYDDIYANTKLRVAYSLFNQQFSDLCNEIINSRELSPHYTTEIAKLFTAKDKAELQKFELEGVTVQNYKDYWK